MQLFFFDGGFENLWPRAPYGALAIGYYCQGCSAAHLPLCGYVSKKARTRAPTALYHDTAIKRSSPSARPPISPSARPPN